jgi:hypothetical protein
MQVRIHNKPAQRTNRKIYPETDQLVSANIVKENKKTVWVKLADNKIIKRDRSQIVEN